MTIRLQVAHQTEGRLRLRLAERGDPEQVARLIAESGLVQSVRANPVTGSIVLEFRGRPEELMGSLADRLPAEVVPASAELQTRSALTLAATSRPFKLVTGNEISPMTMLSTFYAAIGVLQGVRGRVLVPAMTAFWYAFSAYRIGQQAQPAQSQGSAAE